MVKERKILPNPTQQQCLLQLYVVNPRIKQNTLVALIQELVEELQANEGESTDEEQESDATEASDLEQEDTDIPITRMNND